MTFKKGHKFGVGRKLSKESLIKMSNALKGRTVWNKGVKGWISDEQKANIKKANELRVWSVEQRMHLSNIRKGSKGIPCSKETRRIISKKLRGKFKGRNNPFFGKKHSQSTKERISNTHKGLSASDETKRKMSQAREGFIFTPEIKKKISESVTGDKNVNWKGGISFEPYCSKFNDALKEEIRERDCRTCQLCGTKENGKKLSVHHIHYDKENCAPDLIALCNRCSSKANFNRDYYERLFMNKLNERGLLLWR